MPRLPFFYDEFASMSLAPAFTFHVESSPEPLSEFHAQNGGVIQNELYHAYISGGFTALNRIRTPSTYHCMLRHILDSVLRASHLAPFQAERASRAGLRSSDTLSWQLIESQLKALPYATELDKLTAPINARRIPMICQDVPPMSEQP